MDFVKTTYDNLLKSGVAPEMARMVLPEYVHRVYWSGTLTAFARVCNLRCKDDIRKKHNRSQMI